MSVPQKINDLITQNRPKTICDKCIVDALGLTQHAHSAQITGSLGTTSDFERERDTCNSCGEVRIVIHAL